jgi:hypothetical protein
MKPTLFLLLCALLCMAACGKKTATGDQQPDSAPDTTAALRNFIDPSLAHLSTDDVNALVAKADKVDMIFYNHPISVTQEDAPSVRNTVLFIMPTPPSVSAKCPALGRLAWMSEGVIVREADVFLGNGCNYLVFMEGNKAIAANALANEGVQFFTNIISQVNQKQQQLQQPQQQHQ